MGKNYPLKCDKCGYKVMSSGGHNSGMVAVTETYICTTCKEIVNVTVGEYGETYDKNEILVKKKNSETDLDFYVCPECESDKNLVKWNKSKRPCPKCNGKMGIDANGYIVMWD